MIITTADPKILLESIALHFPVSLRVLPHSVGQSRVITPWDGRNHRRHFLYELLHYVCVQHGRMGLRIGWV